MAALDPEVRRLLNRTSATAVAEYLFERATNAEHPSGDHTLELVFRDSHLRRVFVHTQPSMADFGHRPGGPDEVY
jgi:hypothetical protein